MTELKNQRASSDKRLVLGFDAGCFTCSDLAKRIEERVGEKVEVRSLRNLQVAEWRRRALGEDAPWAPTLIEVKGPQVRAWTGWQMGAQLSRFLGPVVTWRVMQTLGEVGASHMAEESPVAKVVTGLSRAQFLKGVAGTAVAMTVLSGAGKLARPAEAASPTKARKLDGNELVDQARRAARTHDMLNVGPGQNFSARVQSGSVTRDCLSGSGAHKRHHKGHHKGHNEETCLTAICYDSSKGCNSHFDKETGEYTLQPGSTVVQGVESTLSDGNTVLTISFTLSNDRVYVYYEYRKAVNGVKSSARRYRVVGKGRAQQEAISTNGSRGTSPRRASSTQAQPSQSSDSVGAAQYDDSTCPDPNNPCPEPTCNEPNFDCIAGHELTCGAICAAAETGVGAALCAGCLLTYGIPASDSGAYGGGPCCNDTTQQYTCEPEGIFGCTF